MTLVVLMIITGAVAVLILVALVAWALCMAAAAGDRHLEQGPEDDGTVVYMPRRLRVVEDDRLPRFDWPKDAA